MPKRIHEGEEGSSVRCPVEAELLKDTNVVGAPPQDFEVMGPNRYTGLSVDHHRPCTSREGHLCHIFGSLKAWNSFFWVVGLELQETSASELSLVKASDGTILTHRATWHERMLAGFYLYELLARHHCVVEATINNEILADHRFRMYHAICDSRGLKRITLELPKPRGHISLRLLAQAIASLTRLESLSLYGDIEGAFLAELAPMLAGTSSLTVLRAFDMNVENPPANTFKEGLMKNTSIKELSLSTVVLDGGTRSHGPGNLDLGLASYLRTSTTLRSLKITAPWPSSVVDVWTICLALSDNTVLIKLDLEVGTLRPHYATPIKNLLNRSKTLKYFCLSYKSFDRSLEVDSEDFEECSALLQYCPRCNENHSEVTKQMKPWITTLLADGLSIKKLKFSMSAFCPVECRGFLRAMARNKSLERLTMTDLYQNTLHVCGILKENDVQQRVLVDSPCILYYPGIDNPPGIGGIVALPFGILLAAPNRVSAAGHITEITLQVSSILCGTGETEPTSTVIVQLIERVPFVKDLVLDFTRGCCNNCWNRCSPAICDAVLRNPTIRGLAVRFLWKYGLDMTPLAGLLHRSKTLRQFEFKHPCSQSFTEFVTKLMTPEFEKNHALQRLKFCYSLDEMVSERLDIQSILERNRSLPIRAAAYVTGNRAKYAAQAFETTLRYPELIEELETAAVIQKDRAKQLVAESARQLADFTEFMCLAGVVRYCVECNPCDDGKTQLGDLPEPCRRHIRQFLRLSDVRDPPE